MPRSWNYFRILPHITACFLGEFDQVKKFGLANKGSGRGSLNRGALALFLLLVLALLVPRPLLTAETSSSYEALRLYTEALDEISQKYVHPKSEEDMIYGSLRGMMSYLDPDSSFLTPSEYKSYLDGKEAQAAEAGVEVIIKDNLALLTSVIDGGPAAAAGLKEGDHILKVNGQMVRNLTTQEMARRFQGAPGTAIKLQVLRNSAIKPLEVTVTLAPLSENTVTSRVLQDSFGYVRLRYFNEATPKEFSLALKALQKQNPGLRGLILDLRNNARAPWRRRCAPPRSFWETRKSSPPKAVPQRTRKPSAARSGTWF